MSDEAGRNHPDIETLAGLAAGELTDDSLSRHLKTCAACRMELRRLDRFERLETDGELQREADWPAAQPRLEQAFRKNVLPEVVGNGSVAGREKPPFWTRWQIRWMAPAAAAAAVLLVFFLSDRIQRPGPASEDLGPLRGTPVDTPDITLDKPVGEVADAPNEFEWTSRSKDDYYTIEIFTSNLDKVFDVARVPDTRWAATDSLKTILKRETVYLWSVTGHKGIEPATVSPNAWFKITDEQP